MPIECDGGALGDAHTHPIPKLKLIHDWSSFQQRDCNTIPPTHDDLQGECPGMLTLYEKEP